MDGISFKGKKVLIRVDFNVPQDAEGTITDDTRIVRALPTIQEVINGGGSAILMSHLGRPSGKEEKFSLKPVAARLSELLGKNVTLAPDVVGQQVKRLVDAMKEGDVLLLENLRFYPAEKKPELDPNFAKEIAELGDCYINDAFGASHREHSSIVKVPEYFPGKSFAGQLVQKELKAFSSMLENPKRPFLAIVGGAKVSSKIGVLKTLSTHVDALVVVGAMAHTFMKAQGLNVGSSLVEEEYLGEAEKILETFSKRQVPLILPQDEVVAKEIAHDAEVKSVDLETEEIPDGYMGLDVGPKTLQTIVTLIAEANTIFWNGPAGVFEIDIFSKGTKEIAKALANSSANTIVGGGDSVAAINQQGLSDQMTHISTGGGALLELIEKQTLPGLNPIYSSKL